MKPHSDDEDPFLVSTSRVSKAVPDEIGIALCKAPRQQGLRSPNQEVWGFLGLIRSPRNPTKTLKKEAKKPGSQRK